MHSSKLPDEVTQVFTSEDFNESILYPEERILCKDYDVKRKQDFIRGRHCAHHCLALNHLKSPVLRGSEGEPKWPDGLTGSISHGHFLTGAIVAKTAHFKSVGIDIESIGRIIPDLWPVLFTQKEMDHLNAIPTLDQPRISTVLFSIKEANYKMNFQLNEQYIDAHDIEVFMDQKEEPRIKTSTRINSEVTPITYVEQEGLNVIAFVLVGNNQ